MIDSGLSDRSSEDVAAFPLLQRLSLGYVAEQGLRQALQSHRLSSPDFILLTHSHWDHTGGLRDLDHPKVFVGPGEKNFIVRMAANKNPSVSTNDLQGATIAEFNWDGPAYENFPRSHDWFGDGSVIVVPLPGHTPGSVGVFVRTSKGQRLLFVGDAAWSTDAISLPCHKLRLASDVADVDRTTLSETLWRLHHLKQHSPDVLFVPTHEAVLH